VYSEDPHVTRVARELGITVIPWSIFRNIKLPKPRIMGLPILEPP
jgi:hypothetical protein